MGIKSLFSGIIGKSSTDHPNDKFIQTVIEYLGNSVIPLRDNNQTYIKEGFNRNLFVNMAVNYITRRASDIPWLLCKKLPDGSEEVINKHWAIDLFNKPNPLQDGKELREQALGFYLLTGNTFQYKVMPGVGANATRPREIWNLPTPFMEILTGKNLLSPIEKYKLNVISNIWFQPSEIIHVKTPSYEWQNAQHYYGVSPLKAALSTINLGNSTTEAMTKQAQHGGALGMLMYDRASNDGNAITPEQFTEVKQRIASAINGPANRGKVVGASQLFKWQELGSKAADLQLIEDHNLTRDDICAVYGLPSVLFNDHSSSTYNNIVEAKKSAYTDAIIPLLENYVSKINREILEKSGEKLYFKLDLSGIPELQKDKGKLIQEIQNAWWIPTSKKQEMTGVEADGELPEYLLPANLMPASMEDVEGAQSKRVINSPYRDA